MSSREKNVYSPRLQAELFHTYTGINILSSMNDTECIFPFYFLSSTQDIW